MSGRNFAFQNELGLTILVKNGLKHYENNLKQLSTSRPWAYIGRAYYRKDFCV